MQNISNEMYYHFTPYYVIVKMGRGLPYSQIFQSVNTLE